MTLIQERKKFGSQYDYTEYRRKVVSEFIDISESSTGASLNKNNIELLRMTNDYFDKYRKFVKITSVLWGLFEAIGSEYGRLKYNLSRVEMSAKKQRTFVFCVKSALKNEAVTSKYYKPIKDTLTGAIKRFDRMYSEIFTEYISMTPLSDRDSMLKAEGSSLIDEIDNEVECIESAGFAVDTKSLDTYVNGIVAGLRNSGEWYERLTEYKKVLKAQQDKRRIEYNKKKCSEEEVLRNEKQEYLYSQAKIFRNNFQSGNTAHRTICTLRQRINEVGGEGHKLVMLLFPGRKSSDPFFYTTNTVNFLTKTCSTAEILRADDELPEQLVKLINDRKLLFTEIILD